MRFYLLFSILFFCGLFKLQAQEDFPQQLSLEEAIEYALENSYNAINAERDLIDAEKQKWETIAEGLPQIDGNIGYQNQLKQPVTLIPSEIFGGQPGTFQEVIFGQAQSMSATATLNQQIFNGTYVVAVQATKTFLEYTQNNKEKTDIEIRKAVTEAYGNVLLAKESYAIFLKDQDNIQKTLNGAVEVFESGMADEENVEQLQITLSLLNNQLANADRFQKITLETLNVILGLPLDNPTKLTDNLDSLTENFIFGEQKANVFDIAKNVDYKMALNLNQQRELELKLAKSRYLPRLNAFINYGTSAFSQNFSFFKSEQSWFDSSIFGVSLDIPIFSSLGRRASTQRAKIALEKAKTQFEQAVEQINLQYNSAESNYIFAIEQYQTNKDNLALATRIEKKNNIKYFEGLATSLDLRQAQTQLFNAQRDYLQSMVNVINQKAALEAIMNQH